MQIVIMAWFVLNSLVNITSASDQHPPFKFSGIHEVRVKRSIHSYADSAIIIVPSIARYVPANGSNPLTITTATMFQEGDAVTIELGYNGGKQTVFQGFVKRLGLNMPLEIECEGYVRLLRLNMDVTAYYKSCMASDLLKLLQFEWEYNGPSAVTGFGGSSKNYSTQGAGTGINVIVAQDMHFVNVPLIHNNGVEIIEHIKRFSQGTLNIFFINPTTLWCGLTYTPYEQNKDPFNNSRIVSYDLGYNCPKENGLKERQPVERVQIMFGGKYATGEKVMVASDIKTAKNKEKTILNNVGDVADMKMMANEKQYMMNYTGYEGSLTGFLQPWCEPGNILKISDKRYPALNGSYMCEGTEVTFGLKGARIKVEVGPQLGFNPG